RRVDPRLGARHGERHQDRRHGPVRRALSDARRGIQARRRKLLHAQAVQRPDQKARALSAALQLIQGPAPAGSVGWGEARVWEEPQEMSEAAPRQNWRADRYATHARYVAELGAPLIDLLAPRPGERILDLGCGDGALTERLAALGCSVLGVDSAPEMVAAARRRGLD